MTELLLWGAPGSWPFRGAFRGQHTGLAWAGRVGQQAPLDVAFRMARSVDAALYDVRASDRRRRVAAAWDALMALDLLEFSSDLCALLVAQDDDGCTVSGVGLAAVLATDGSSPPQPWIPTGHPMLSGRGVPASRPGALSTPDLPPVLVALAADDPMPSLPSGAPQLRAGSGVWP